MVGELVDLLKKFLELHNKGQSISEITENIFLNYNAFDNNDEIFVLKKLISQKFNVEINSVKLIGSSHTGFKDFEKKDNPKDFDFAIIDPFYFREIMYKVNINNLKEENKVNYIENVLKGKIHVLYINNEIKYDINQNILAVKDRYFEITGKKIVKSLTVCIYISEKSFAKCQSDFLQLKFAEHLKRESAVIKEIKKII